MWYFRESLKAGTNARAPGPNLGPGGGGGTLIFSYIRRLGPFFGGSKF